MLHGATEASSLEDVWYNESYHAFSVTNESPLTHCSARIRRLLSRQHQVVVCPSLADDGSCPGAARPSLRTAPYSHDRPVSWRPIKLDFELATSQKIVKPITSTYLSKLCPSTIPHQFSPLVCTKLASCRKNTLRGHTLSSWYGCNVVSVDSTRIDR